MIALGPARPEEAATLGCILAGWVAETDWMPRLHTAAEDTAFVARHIAAGRVQVARDGAPLGFLIRDGEDVLALYLAPRARRRGIGRALLAQAQEASDSLSLWCFQANAGAQAFYRREGFAEVARTAGDNEEGLPDIRLIWRLVWRRQEAMP